MDKLVEMKSLRSEWDGCNRCELSVRRNKSDKRKLVFGRGNLNTDIVFVGEGPGTQEELDGAPFTGQSGAILDGFFEAYGVHRKSVFLTNIVSCRACKESDKIEGQKRAPVIDSAPTVASVKACSERLHKQIYIIDPLLIVLLGRSALKALGGHKYNVTELIGDVITVKIPGKTKSGEDPRMLSYPALVTWHPANILRRGAQGIQDKSEGGMLDQYAKSLNKAFDLVARYKGQLEGDENVGET